LGKRLQYGIESRMGDTDRRLFQQLQLGRGGVVPAEPPKTGGETMRVRYGAIYLFLHKAERSRSRSPN
jgi:hypothetical protein